MEDPRYPIGHYQLVDNPTDAMRNEWIQHISDLPKNLRAAVSGLNASRLATPYRDGGWNVTQVVHHLADSHMNAFIRFKLALTEAKPTIKPYKENLWAEVIEARTAPVEASLKILEGLHERLIILLRSFKPEDFRITFIHPERGEMNFDTYVQIYAWHSRHHVAHITELRKRMGW